MKLQRDFRLVDFISFLSDISNAHENDDVYIPEKTRAKLHFYEVDGHRMDCTSGYRLSIYRGSQTHFAKIGAKIWLILIISFPS